MILRRQFAIMLRRFPFLLLIPYYTWRLFQARFTVGVIAVVVNDKQQVLLVEHLFHAVHPWGLPGGWVDRNEDPEVAVVRELEEELELKVEIQQMLIMGSTVRNHIDIAYLCTPRNTVGELSFELMSYAWVDLEDIPRLRPFHALALNTAKALLAPEVENYGI